MNANNLNFVRPFHNSLANYLSIIFGAVTIFGIISWYFIPQKKCQWLSLPSVAYGY